jgi:UDP-glucose 4-epimerase
MANQEVWLLTGGAGYIGAHIADEFLSAAKQVVIYDSLYKGLTSRVEYLNKKHKTEIPLIKADIRDYQTFARTLKDYKVTGIVHTAALKSVEESMSKRDDYIEVNYTATVELLEIAKRVEVKHFIFSSTAAVYGSPDSIEPCKESAQTDPISPYGESKLMAEAKVAEFAKIDGNFATSLRFFNVVGCADLALLDNSTENLVPIVINNLAAKKPIQIFGSGYPTPDGTCVRDYVDVRDVAIAHLLAADAEKVLPTEINVGTGRGASVKEIIDLVLEASNKKDAEVITTDGRPGDPAFLCADVNLAKSALNYQSKYSLKESVISLF